MAFYSLLGSISGHFEHMKWFQVIDLPPKPKQNSERIRSWDVDLNCCDLDQQLQLFITRHSAHFSSESLASISPERITKPSLKLQDSCEPQ
uniref:Microtubule-associated protein 1B/S N-terminal domain-containing protein n=1 Tax=Oreochromis aureus TaxID=47969 RepID=A0AAZ1X5J1_OREAU